MSRQNIRQNSNQNNQSQYKGQNLNQQQQSSNQLTIPPAARKALDSIKKARANRSEFMALETDVTYRLQFDISKVHLEDKVFNGKTSQRISHAVVDVNDPDAGEKTLSLTFKQSKPIEDAMEEGYSVMDVTKTGEGFALTYQVSPIE